MKKIFTILIISFLIGGFIFISGCASAKDDISRSSSLMDNGRDKVSKIDFTKGLSTSTKADLDSAKTDYEQALLILTNAKTDSDDEKSTIQLNINKCNYALKVIDGLKNYVDFLAHINKVQAYLTVSDFSSAHFSSADNEIRFANQSFNKALTSFKGANQILNQMNINSLAPESKSHFVKMQSINQYIAAENDFSSLFDGYDNLITAGNYLTQGDNYAKSYNIPLAKAEYSLGKTELQKAKIKFDTLKNSKISEISILAIQVSSKLDDSLASFYIIDSVLSIYFF
jgi:hypothetical protein